MSLKGKRVLVTGGAGFIGSHLVDRLVQEDVSRLVIVDNFFLGRESNLAEALVLRPDIEILRMDASSESGMRSIVNKEDIEVVFNLAVVPLPTSLSFPSWTTRINMETVLTLCELARLDDIEELIHISSSETYGSARYVPMDERHPLDAITPYAASKAAADQIINSYIQTFGINATILRPFNNFGPRQNPGSYAGVIPKIIYWLKEDRPIQIYGSGNQTRDFIFVQITADLIVRAFSLPNTKGQTINMATGVETSILSLVKMMTSAWGKPMHPIEFLPERQGDVLRHCADTALMKEMFGFAGAPINEKHLQSTIEWYCR